MLIALLLVVWRALGFPLSFGKGKRGPELVWIAGKLATALAGVQVAIKQDIVQDVEAVHDSMASSNVAPLKLLRTYVGKVNIIASLVFMVRPFLSELWAALSCNSKASNAPRNYIWRCQIDPALGWILSFLAGAPGKLERQYSLTSYTGAGHAVDLCMEASPWGLGAYLALDGHIVDYCESNITDNEGKPLGQ